MDSAQNILFTSVNRLKQNLEFYCVEGDIL
jgi:hypothetical protein